MRSEESGMSDIETAKASKGTIITQGLVRKVISRGHDRFIRSGLSSHNYHHNSYYYPTTSSSSFPFRHSHNRTYHRWIDEGRPRYSFPHQNYRVNHQGANRTQPKYSYPNRPKGNKERAKRTQYIEEINNNNRDEHLPHSRKVYFSQKYMSHKHQLKQLKEMKTRRENGNIQNNPTIIRHQISRSSSKDRSNRPQAPMNTTQFIISEQTFTMFNQTPSSSPRPHITFDPIDSMKESMQIWEGRAKEDAEEVEGAVESRRRASELYKYNIGESEQGRWKDSSSSDPIFPNPDRVILDKNQQRNMNELIDGGDSEANRNTKEVEDLEHLEQPEQDLEYINDKYKGRKGQKLCLREIIQ